MSQELEGNKIKQAEQLQILLDAHKDKRVVVVGTTCTGKSTLLAHIEGAQDMDELLFPQLSKEESDYVNQTLWTEEIGRTMVRLAREKVKVEVGKPVFATVILDCDLIIQLMISDELLQQRTALRRKRFEGAKNMQGQIQEEIKKSGIPVIEFNVG